MAMKKLYWVGAILVVAVASVLLVQRRLVTPTLAELRPPLALQGDRNLQGRIEEIQISGLSGPVKSASYNMKSKSLTPGPSGLLYAADQLLPYSVGMQSSDDRAYDLFVSNHGNLRRIALPVPHVTRIVRGSTGLIGVGYRDPPHAFASVEPSGPLLFQVSDRRILLEEPARALFTGPDFNPRTGKICVAITRWQRVVPSVSVAVINDTEALQESTPHTDAIALAARWEEETNSVLVLLDGGKLARVDLLTGGWSSVATDLEWQDFLVIGDNDILAITSQTADAVHLHRYKVAANGLSYAKSLDVPINP